MAGRKRRRRGNGSSNGNGSGRIERLDINEAVRDILKHTAAVSPHTQRYVSDHWRELAKAQRPGPMPQYAPKSYQVDPYNLIYAMGWKERVSSITDQTIKELEVQVPYIRAIINVRSAQHEMFLQDYRNNENGIGLAVWHRDTAPPRGLVGSNGASRKRKMNETEQKRADELLKWIMACGMADRYGRPIQNPEAAQSRDNIRIFSRKVIRDTYLFDKVGIEKVPTKSGMKNPQDKDSIFEFLAVDGSSLRLALDQRVGSTFQTPVNRNLAKPLGTTALFDDREYNPISTDGNPVKYVQVLHGQIVTTYSENELLWAIRNPRADVQVAGYGFPEPEQLITVLTSILFQDQDHRNFFRGAQRGILAISGMWPKQQFAGFRRNYMAMAAGVENSYRTPFLDLGQDGKLDYIDLRKTEDESHGLQWAEFLLQTTCGVYLMEPEEIAHPIGGTGGQSPLIDQSSGDWKLRASRDRGLPPLIYFMTNGVWQPLLDRKDPDYCIGYIGLDQPTAQDQHKQRMEELSSWRTLNEVREERGEGPIEDGDIPLNPTLVQWKLAKEQMRQAQQSLQPGGGEGMQSPFPPGGGEGGDEKPTLQ